MTSWHKNHNIDHRDVYHSLWEGQQLSRSKTSTLISNHVSQKKGDNRWKIYENLKLGVAVEIGLGLYNSIIN